MTISPSLMAGLCHLCQLFCYGNRDFSVSTEYEVVNKMVTHLLGAQHIICLVELMIEGEVHLRLLCVKKRLVISDLEKNSGRPHTEHKPKYLSLLVS